MSDNPAANDNVIGTIDHLNVRLQRLEFYMSGEVIEDTSQLVAPRSRDATVQARIAQLHMTLEKLSSKSRVVQEILSLRMLVITSCQMYY